MTEIDITLGSERLALSVPERKRLAGRRIEQPQSLGDVPAAVRQALESPLEFPPLRRALTPDDHVVVVLGDVGDVGGRDGGARDQILTPVLEYLLAAGLKAESITLLSPPDADPQAEGLPPPFEGIRGETHDPAERRKLSYLASTRAGRRIYLNRTLVDADQLVVVGTAGYDPVLGYGGGLGDVFPALSDEATRREFESKTSEAAPGAKPWPARQEANEVGWLLGMPFVLQVVEGAGEEVSHVLGGTAHAVAQEAHRLLDRYWRVSVERLADLVIAEIGGRQTLANVTRGLACAARVVRPGGQIVVLSRATAPPGPAVELLQKADDPARALAEIRRQHLPDATSVWQLATAARQAQLYLLSDIPSETVEELFITPLEQAGQVQRLIDAAESCLFLSDAQRTMAVLQKEGPG